MTSFRFRASVLLLAFAATGAFSRAVSSVPGGRPILQDAEGMSSSSQASASAASASASASATATATSTATDIVVKTLVKTTTITLHPYGNRPRPTEAAKSTIFLAVKPDGDVHTLPSHEWVDKYGPPDVEDESIPDDFAGSGIYPDPPPLPWELPWKRSESAPKDLSHEALNEMRKHLDLLGVALDSNVTPLNVPVFWVDEKILEFPEAVRKGTERDLEARRLQAEEYIQKFAMYALGESCKQVVAAADKGSIFEKRDKKKTKQIDPHSSVDLLAALRSILRRQPVSLREILEFARALLNADKKTLKKFNDGIKTGEAREFIVLVMKILADEHCVKYPAPCEPCTTTVYNKYPWNVGPVLTVYTKTKTITKEKDCHGCQFITTADLPHGEGPHAEYKATKTAKEHTTVTVYECKESKKRGLPHVPVETGALEAEA